MPSVLPAAERRHIPRENELRAGPPPRGLPEFVEVRDVRVVALAGGRGALLAHALLLLLPTRQLLLVDLDAAHGDAALGGRAGALGRGAGCAGCRMPAPYAAPRPVGRRRGWFLIRRSGSRSCLRAEQGSARRCPRRRCASRRGIWIQHWPWGVWSPRFSTHRVGSTFYFRTERHQSYASEATPATASSPRS